MNEGAATLELITATAVRTVDGEARYFAPGTAAGAMYGMWNKMWSKLHIWQLYRSCSIKSFFGRRTKQLAGLNGIVLH